MPIPVCCPQCQQRFQLADKFAGCKIRCPMCSAAEILVPGVSAVGAPANADEPYKLKPLASAGISLPGQTDSVPSVALRNGLLISGVVLGVMLLVGGVAVASLFTWGAVARLGEVDLPDWGSEEVTVQPIEEGFRPAPSPQVLKREPDVVVTRAEPRPNPPNDASSAPGLNSSVIVSVPLLPETAPTPRPQPYSPGPANRLTWELYRGTQHPFEVLLPSRNVMVMPLPNETIYQWVPGHQGLPPTGSMSVQGQVMIRIVYHRRMPGESDQEAIERLEQTRWLGHAKQTFRGTPLQRTTPTINGYVAVDRQLTGNHDVAWLSTTVPHSTGIYHLQAVAHKSQMTQEYLDTIKRSFRFTQ